MNEYNKSSKYVKEGSVKLSKKFILSVFLTKLMQIVLFLGILGILSYGGYSIFSSDKIPLNTGEIVSVKDEEPLLNSKVLFYFNKKTANKGKVIGIPYSIVEYEGKTIQLKQKEYLLLNQNNESKIVNIKNIYGIEKS